MGFTFKKFHVRDDRCAMKVGTDAVLLGSWASVQQAERILDIGTGCGIIALMLAQRSNAMIDAIEIDENATSQARTNFENSPWKNRLHAFHISLKSFYRDHEGKYDLIASNPPYFSNQLQSPDPNTNVAKHNASMDMDILMFITAKLMGDHGRCSFVIPVSEEKRLTDQALMNGLRPDRKMMVIPAEGKAPNRILLEFRNSGYARLKTKTITLRNSQGHYTPEFTELTQDFYL